MSLHALCNTTADIQRKTVSRSARAMLTETWATVYDDIRVSVQPARGSVRNEFAAEGLAITHSIYTDTSLSLQGGDKVIVGSDTYIVQAWGDMAGRSRGWIIHALKKE